MRVLSFLPRRLMKEEYLYAAKGGDGLTPIRLSFRHFFFLIPMLFCHKTYSGRKLTIFYSYRVN